MLLQVVNRNLISFMNNPGQQAKKGLLHISMQQQAAV
jgi:hypothetical protein